MAYNPKDYVPDFSWIASAGQQFASTIMKLPEAIKADQVIKENKVNKTEMYEGAQAHIDAMPDDVLEKAGLDRGGLLKKMPKPTQHRSENLAAYTRRWSAWYNQIAQTLQQSGVTAADLQKWATAAPAQTGVGTSAQTKATVAEARKGELGALERTAAGIPTAEQAGAQEALQGLGYSAKDATIQPIGAGETGKLGGPGAEPIGGAAPVVPPKPATKQEFARGVTEEARKQGVAQPTGAEIRGMGTMEGLGAGVTDYQKLMLAKHGQQTTAQQQQQFRQEYDMLDGNVKTTQTAVDTARGKQAKTLKRQAELPELIATAQEAADDATTIEERKEASKQLTALTKEQKTSEAYLIKAPSEIEKAQDMALAASKTFELYSKPGITLEQAVREGREIAKGKGLPDKGIGGGEAKKKTITPRALKEARVKFGTNKEAARKWFAQQGYEVN